jgi:hypothetical protein
MGGFDRDVYLNFTFPPDPHGKCCTGTNRVHGRYLDASMNHGLRTDAMGSVPMIRCLALCYLTILTEVTQLDASWIMGAVRNSVTV